MAELIAELEARLSVNSGDTDAALAKARMALAAVEKQMHLLTSEQKKGAIQTADYNRQMAELTVAQGRIVTAMSGAASRTNSLNTAMNSVATQGSRNLGRSVLLASQGIEDLQYGFSAVLNNIPIFVSSLGYGAGLAGGISLVGVAANVAMKHWDKLMDAFGSSATETATQEMERLGKATKLTADEQDRLVRLKDQKAGMSANEGSKTEAQKKELAAYGKALDEAPATAVRDVISGIRKRDNLDTKINESQRDRITAAESRESDINKAQSFGLPPDPATLLTVIIKGNVDSIKDDIRREIAASENEAIGKLIGDVRSVAGPEGKGARETLRKMVEANPKLFDAIPGFASNLKDAAAGREVKTEAEKNKKSAAGDNQLSADNKRIDNEFNEGLKNSEQDAKQAVDAAISALQNRFNRIVASGGSVGLEGITRAIIESGLEQSQQMQFPVLQGLTKNYETEVARRRAERGISEDQATAEIASEAQAKLDAPQEKLDTNEEKAKKKLDKKISDNVKEFLKDDKDMATAIEKENDLSWRMRGLLKPVKKSESLSLDSYENSIKSTNGEDQVKLLHNIHELWKDYIRNQQNIKILAVKKNR